MRRVTRLGEGLASCSAGRFAEGTRGGEPEGRGRQGARARGWAPWRRERRRYNLFHLQAFAFPSGSLLRRTDRVLSSSFYKQESRPGCPRSTGNRKKRGVRCDLPGPSRQPLGRRAQGGRRAHPRTAATGANERGHLHWPVSSSGATYPHGPHWSLDDTPKALGEGPHRSLVSGHGAQAQLPTLRKGPHSPPFHGSPSAGRRCPVPRPYPVVMSSSSVMVLPMRSLSLM